MNYYLLLKTHNQTGLNYLCKFTERVKVKSPYKYKGSGTYWQRHINKHGYDVETQVLYQGQSEQELSACAIFWSNVYDVVKNKKFANLIPENGLDGGSKGSKHSEEHIAKMRIAMLGKNLGKKSCLGRKHTIESKLKMSIARLGKKVSEETKQKLRIANLGNKYSLGHKQSEEHKRKVSIALLGNKNWLGKKLSKENK